ncbi:AER029Cp [Eremothecium gossypii ATCC 10895]|uniref:AER029Cp n=1 Tax=Eremothecium gossypii (strain ATCC 10895 / CBS 109.51 / FGSC 9923 / NRRL Y-1056) TaxID=284811 RepID=Q757I4_EREGS|nr:AER029Cp [Eremothecium gossypii ATCC 10895]AAS52713.2 AER029Cp [Eremothecium gossypii ATCC 10895]
MERESPCKVCPVAEGERVLIDGPNVHAVETVRRILASKRPKMPMEAMHAMCEQQGAKCRATAQNTDSDAPSVVTIAKEQWERLVSSINSLSLGPDGPAAAGESTEHKGVRCDGCWSKYGDGAGFIRGLRYRCVCCDDFNLCAECEATGYTGSQHDSGHAMLKIKNPQHPWWRALRMPVHYRVVCDGCNPGVIRVVDTETCSEEGYIQGPRFHCLQCLDHDYCARCVANEMGTGTHRPSHSMELIRLPGYRPTHTYASPRSGGMRCAGRCESDLTGRQYYRCIQCDAFHLCVDCFHKGVAIVEHVNAHGISCQDTSPASLFVGEPSPGELPSLIRAPLASVCIFAPDISVAAATLFSQVHDVKDLERIASQCAAYESLVPRFGASAEELERKLSSLPPKATEDEFGISVTVSRVDFALTFRLRNYTTDAIPSSSSLVFSHHPVGGSSHTRTMSIGPHELPPGSSKQLNICYPHQTSDGDPYSLSLVSPAGTALYSGKASSMPADILLACPGGTPASSAAFNAMYTNQSSASVPAPVVNAPFRQSNSPVMPSDEEYDLLSDSDIEVV